MAFATRRPTLSRHALLTIAATLAVAGCLRAQPKAPEAPQHTGLAAGVPAPDVEKLLAQMTLDEKIGQMTQADRSALQAGDIEALFLGSILNGGDGAPSPNTPESWAEMYDRFQTQALKTRLAIPIIYGVDAVHGFGLLKGATVFPHNIGLGATRDPGLVEKVGRVTALEVAATGLDWTFGPCVAVPRDERWGRTYEGFGETPELAAMMGGAAVRGLQGDKLGGPRSIIASTKHFVGDGATMGGKDQGDARISEEDLRTIHLPGYIAAIKAGTGTIMVSYSSWNGRPMHANRYLLTDVLKGELGFQGFVVTDWEGLDKMPGSYEQDVEAGINAGIDMVMVPTHYRDFIAILRDLVKANRVPLARIDDAVRRILRVKAAAGIWERPMSDRKMLGQIGAPENRAVARDAVRQSLVLLKNERRALPLAKRAHVHVAGAKADDIGAQCGGWTVTWQGKLGDITSGTTVLQAIRRAVAPGTKVTYSADASGAGAADVVVVVIGEEPYAEGRGDRKDLHLGNADVRAVANARASGKPVVVVLFSGRPVLLDDVLPNADALVAAWLPGSEGDGVADVLFGDAKPAGKLPHTWPRTMAQIPINQGDADYDPLFPYGFGLTY